MANLTLVFDTETSGLRRDHLPADAPDQPHIVEIAAQVYREEKLVNFMQTLIKPNGWSIEPGATAVHGITDEMAYRDGVDLDAALRFFQVLVIQSGIVVSHNAQFDRLMIQSELDRLGAQGKWWGRADKFRCSMEMSTELVGLPNPSGRPGNKFPTLEEAHAHFFEDAGWKSNHRAWDDTSACARIWFRLQETT